MSPLYLHALFALALLCGPVFAFFAVAYVLEALFRPEAGPDHGYVITKNGYVLSRKHGSYVPRRALGH